MPVRLVIPEPGQAIVIAPQIVRPPYPVRLNNKGSDIQLLDSVKLDNNKLLPQRSHYSYQLKNYLEGQEGLVNRTCFVYFDTNKSKLEKTVAKLKAKFQKGQNVLIRPVDPTLFRFTKPEEE